MLGHLYRATVLASLGLFPLSSLAQVAANAPVTSPDAPPSGETIIKYNDVFIVIVGQVEMIPLEHGEGIAFALPEGATPLPADHFTPLTLPDGRTGYAPHGISNLSISSSVTRTPLPETYVPPYLLAQIIPDDANAIVTPGNIQRGDTILSVPYSYRHLVHLTDDLTVTDSHDSKILVRKDEPGFDAGQFDNGPAHKHLLCFFDEQKPEGYAVPDCYVKAATPDGSLTLTPAVVTNNIPTSYGISPSAKAIKAPAIASGAPAINHTFHLELHVNGYTVLGHNFGYSWQSDGRQVKAVLIANAGDTVEIPVVKGSFSINKDSGQYQVAFTPAPGTSSTPVTQTATGKP